MTARREHELDEVAERIAERGQKSMKVVADITQPDTIPTIVDRAMNELGSIDTWVSNAGRVPSSGYTTMPYWRATVATEACSLSTPCGSCKGPSSRPGVMRTPCCERIAASAIGALWLALPR